ncbi:MAG: hypothetical protein HY006_00435 [Candidatus Sungbacteria bacterium]|nr:hypothetical protein [Candidatus Sungbacteria bacterium]
MVPSRGGQASRLAPRSLDGGGCFSPDSFAIFERCGSAAPFSCGGGAPTVRRNLFVPTLAGASLLLRFWLGLWSRLGLHLLRTHYDLKLLAPRYAVRTFV